MENIVSFRVKDERELMHYKAIAAKTGISMTALILKAMREMYLKKDLHLVFDEDEDEVYHS
jgi:hypothetical protein